MACRNSDNTFTHDVGELVLVKWNDGMVYFAKIKRIDWTKRKCIVIFDDRSTDEAFFSQVHSVDETTTDIICIKCKKDDSESPNEIVLCDSCGIGFHQKCHFPPIPIEAVELDNPWHCVYCVKQVKNPYLTESIDVMQSLFDAEEDDDNVNVNNNSAACIDTASSPVLQHKFPSTSHVQVKIEVEGTNRQCQAVSSPLSPSDMQISAAPKRKVGRPRLTETARRGKIRPLEAFRRKIAKTSAGRASADRVNNWRRRQLKDDTATSPNVRKEATVESHTLSIQRTSVPPHDNVNDIITDDNSNRKRSDNSSSDNSYYHPKRPRSLRVSLTLPPNFDANSPVSLSLSRKTSNESLLSLNEQQQHLQKSPDSMKGSVGNEVFDGSMPDSVGYAFSVSPKGEANFQQCREMSSDDIEELQIDSSGNETEMEIDSTLIQSKTTEFTSSKDDENVSIQSQPADNSAAIDNDDVIILEPNEEEPRPVITCNPVIISDTTKTRPERHSITQEAPATTTTPVVPTTSATHVHSPLEQLQMQIKQSNMQRAVATKTAAPRYHVPIHPKPALISMANKPAPTASNIMANISSPVTSNVIRSMPLITYHHTEPSVQASKEHNKRSKILQQQANETVHESQAKSSNTSVMVISQPAASAGHCINQVVDRSMPPLMHGGGNPVLVGPTTITATGEVASIYTLVQNNDNSVILAPGNTVTSPSGNIVTTPVHNDVVQLHTQPPLVFTQDTVPISPNGITSPVVIVSESLPVMYTPVQSTTTATLVAPNHNPQNISYYAIIPESHQSGSSHQLTVNTTKPYAVVNAIPTARHPSPPPTIPIRQNNTLPQLQMSKRNRTVQLPPAPPIVASSGQHKLMAQPHFVKRSRLGSVEELKEQNAVSSDMVSQLYTMRNKFGKNFDNITEEKLIEMFHMAYKQFQENHKKYSPLVKYVYQHNLAKPRAATRQSVPVTYLRQSPGHVGPPKTTTRHPKRLCHYSSSRRHNNPPLSSPPLYYQTATTTHSHFPRSSPSTVIDITDTSPTELSTTSSSSLQQKHKGYIHTSGVFVPPPAIELKHHMYVPPARRQTYLVADSQSAAVTGANVPPVMRYADPISQKTSDLPHVILDKRPTGAAKRKEKDTRVCKRCGKDATYLCSGCHNEWYCGNNCQLKEWDRHSEHCKK